MKLITPDIGLVFWMVISFSVVVFLLRKFAWKPILKMLRERESYISDALKSAERAKEEMAKLQADNEKIINEARTERDKLLKEARETKDAIIADAKEKAGAEANKIIENAKLAIDNEKAAALNDVKDQITVLSIEIAEKILGNELADKTKQQGFAAEQLKAIKLN